MITLAEFNSQKLSLDYFSNDPILNGIACPKCNSELFDSLPNMILACSPPKKDVHCSKCDYHGYRYA